MAGPVYTYQVLKDTTERVVVKLTGAFDGTGGQESNIARIPANTFLGALATNGYLRANAQGGAANTALPYYDLQVIRLTYNINFGSTGYVQMFWTGQGGSAANNATIVNISYYGEYGEAQAHPPFMNNAIGPNGDIGVATVNATANTSYTIVIEMRKNNAHYQRGQFSDPAAFNAPPYNLKP
jgi:hypothetical protein